MDDCSTHYPKSTSCHLSFPSLVPFLVIGHPRIANLCEKAGLLQRALEHYEDIADIKCAIVHTTGLPSDWLVNYFSCLTTEQSMICLQEMLRVSIRQNLQVVIEIATKYSDILGPVKLIEMFESFKTFKGLYYYLSQTCRSAPIDHRLRSIRRA